MILLQLSWKQIIRNHFTYKLFIKVIYFHSFWGSNLIRVVHIFWWIMLDICDCMYSWVHKWKIRDDFPSSSVVTVSTQNHQVQSRCSRETQDQVSVKLENLVRWGKNSTFPSVDLSSSLFYVCSCLKIHYLTYISYKQLIALSSSDGSWDLEGHLHYMGLFAKVLVEQASLLSIETCSST